MVCTDLAARGLDLVVDHVIMFDFPSTSVCFIYGYVYASVNKLNVYNFLIFLFVLRLTTSIALEEQLAWEQKVHSLFAYASILLLRKLIIF